MSIRLSLLSLSLLVATVACQRTEVAPAVPEAPATPPAAPSPAELQSPDGAPAAGDVRTYAFMCGDLAVTANYHGADTATVTFGERTLQMNHVPSGSGARYTDAEGNEFWTKGDSEGVLTLKGEAARNCTGSPPG